MPDDPKPPEGLPPPPPAGGGPDEETVKGWIAEAIAEALENPEPAEPTSRPTTAREREAIAEAAARKAVEAVKAADPKPPAPDDKPPVVEPVRKTRFRAAADKFWGVVDEVVKP